MITTTRSTLLMILVCLSTLAFLQLSHAQCSDCNKSDLLCGPKCLLVVCQKFGVESSLEELAALSGTDEQGTSLAGLDAVVGAKGLEAVEIKIGADELAGLKCPAIAHLWNNHFVVVEADSPDKLKVTNPPGEPDGRKYQLVATLLGSAPAGYLKSDTVIRTNDPLQPEIKVPVYALVEE